MSAIEDRRVGLAEMPLWQHEYCINTYMKYAEGEIPVKARDGMLKANVLECEDLDVSQARPTKNSQPCLDTQNETTSDSTTEGLGCIHLVSY